MLNKFEKEELNLLVNLKFYNEKTYFEIECLNKGEVLTRAQLKKVMGGNGSGTGSDLGCQPGDTLMYEGPDGCGYSIVVVKLPNGDCLYDEPHIQDPQHCAYA